jgi:hypothetical protein
MAVTAHGWRHGRSRGHRNPRLPVLFILPAALIFVALMAIPMIGAIVLSFESWDGLRPPTWIGLTNYWNLLRDRIFLLALEHTAYFVVVTVILQTMIPLLVANLLTSVIRGSLVFRTIYFLPVIISLAISGMLWSMIYEPNFGVLNTLLNSLGLHGLTRFWLADNKTVMPSVIAVSVWQSMGAHHRRLSGVAAAVLQGPDPARGPRRGPWDEYVVMKTVSTRVILSGARLLTPVCTSLKAGGPQRTVNPGAQAPQSTRILHVARRSLG